MDVVVTGAGGFSGSHVVPALLKRGHRVTAIVGRTRGRLDPALDGPDLTIVSGNLAEPLQLPPRIDAVVHTAARSPSPDVTITDMVRDNFVATRRLIDYAVSAGARTFVYFSSLSVYGTIAGPVADEHTPVASNDPYGLTKYLGEMVLRETLMRSLSIRLPGVIGRDPVRNWLTGVLQAAKAGRDIRIYNPDKPFNNAAHVDDLCRFVTGLLEGHWSGHHAVTVGAKGSTTTRQAVQIILEKLGSTSQVIVSPAARDGFQISSDHACRAFGYEPMDIADMLRLFAESNRDS